MVATTRPVAGSMRCTPALAALVAKVPHSDPAPTAMTSLTSWSGWVTAPLRGSMRLTAVLMLVTQMASTPARMIPGILGTRTGDSTRLLRASMRATTPGSGSARRVLAVLRYLGSDGCPHERLRVKP
jgi:hypothetical protein